MTRPGEGMRTAMARAEVGDDVIDRDPTVDRLERRIAELLGKDRALFFPSGTQANQTAIMSQTEPGNEVVCESQSHVFNYELSGAAMLSNVQLHPVASEHGSPEPERVRRAIRPGDARHAVTGLLCMENTHNMHGGTVVPLTRLEELYCLAEQRGLKLHLDGARLWNASRASGVPLKKYGQTAHTVMVSLSKGLGCPVGSMLAGPSQTMENARVIRKRLGGGMRQSGILAAAGLYALERNRVRLEEDHRRARELARACDGVKGLRCAEPDTNIVMIELTDDTLSANQLSEYLEHRGVKILPVGPRRLRAVTHLDVDDEGIEQAHRTMKEGVVDLAK